MSEFEKFVASYLETALWSSSGDEGGPEFLDAEYSADDFDEGCLERLKVDLRRWWDANQEYIQRWDNPRYSAASMAGHDLWLTQNHHGAGFWDGDWPKKAGEILTERAHKWGDLDIYVGDEGKLWVSGYEHEVVHSKLDE